MLGLLSSSAWAQVDTADVETAERDAQTGVDSPLEARVDTNEARVFEATGSSHESSNPSTSTSNETSSATTNASNATTPEVADHDGARDDEPTLRWLPGAELFFAYRFQVLPADGANERSWFHVFELERTLAWLGARYGDLEARVMLEAVQGADEAGLLAVAGDSMVLRVREAWMGYELFDRVRIRAGIVPELTQPFVESVESLRPIGKGPHERFGLLAPADAGANVTVQLPLQLGEVGAGVYSGESYRSRELNRGKSTELFVRLRPLATIEALRPLVVGGGYFLGSEGAGSARANRATVLLGWDSPWLKVGGSFTHAQGFAGNGSRTGWLVHGFARLELLNRLLLGARVVHFRRNADASDDTVSSYQGTVGVRVVEPLETYLVLTQNVAGERAAAALPGSDSWELSAVVRGRLEER
ncbi:MAG: hypothetical protein KC586_01840 [Myxococcales bacterium]|nr:hypothetical protein [Myxococcales bacterium]